MQIEVVPPDPYWPAQYDRIADVVRGCLGRRVLSLQHVGSTAVPGLHAKPVVDVDLTVADSADEASYLTDLAAVGFVLAIREPDWEQHRCLVLRTPRCNLHVFSPGAIEPQRHVAFRDWLATHAEDRNSYATLKRSLATHSHTSVMAYNNEKAELIYEIYERIFAADPNVAHVPRPLPSLRDAHDMLR